MAEQGNDSSPLAEVLARVGGHGPDRQPHADRSQQLALRYHQAGHADGLGGHGGAQPRQPQPARERRPHVRPDRRGARSTISAAATPATTHAHRRAGRRHWITGRRWRVAAPGSWLATRPPARRYRPGLGGIQPRGGAAGEQAQGSDGQASGGVGEEVVGRGEHHEGGGRG